MKKETKVCLLDFDGTLVSEDILTLLCGIAGKLEESEKLNDAFNRGELKGVGSLVSRINLLTGITKSQIVDLLNKNNYLMPGAEALIKFLKDNKIITILASGNIPPVLEYYQRLLGIDYIVGSNPNMEGEKILGITESSFSSPKFKLDGILSIIPQM
ncbi:MAG: haloacid dehalogenase-like hydrolase [bacterium]|nr:haloacid dehalogenase-like hydrolase [bacterium]